MKPLSDVDAMPGPVVGGSPKQKDIPEPPMVPITIHIPPWLADMIQAEAELEYIYATQVARRILIQHYKRLQKEPPQSED